MGLEQVVAVVVVIKAKENQAKYYKRFSVAVLSFVLVFLQLVTVADTDSTFSLNTYYYHLVPGLSILKPSIDYKNEITLDTIITGRLTLDRVQTDPVDAISSASQTMGSTISKVDIRQEYVTGITKTLGDWKLGAGMLVSFEKDYRSYSPSILFSKDFNMRNTTLSFGYAHNFDTVHGQYMSAEENKDVDNYSISLTQVLSRNTLLQTSYTNQINQGFLSTGNRKLVLSNGLEYDEYLPSYRKREAVGVRLAQWFKTETAVHLGYRYYVDDWELSSNTYEIVLHQRLSDRFKIKVEYRYYDQSDVYFAKDLYTGAEKYLTTANALRSFSSQLQGFNIVYRPKKYEDYHVNFGIEHYSQSSGLKGMIYRVNIEGHY